MTTPDHHPYLLPSDLRTAEDACDWLMAHSTLPHVTAVDAGHALNEILDRQRRQACRMAVKAEFLLARHHRAFERDADRPVWKDAWRRNRVLRIQRALSFRAAARGK